MAMGITAIAPVAVLSTALAGFANALADGEWSGTWEQELTRASGGGEQKLEALIDAEWQARAGEAYITSLFRVRLDTSGELGPRDRKADTYGDLNGPLYQQRRAALEWRELYLDMTWAGADWRLGKQQVVWGQADGLKVLDAVNPQSFREFILDDFDDSRIPLWMLNAEWGLGDNSSLQLLWIPDTSGHELAAPGTPFAFTSPELVPQLPAAGQSAVTLDEARLPDSFWGDSDWGLRYSLFAGGWDITLNYLYHYRDQAVLKLRTRDTEASPQVTLTPEYRRNHLLGGTASTALGDLVVRAELGLNTDTFHLTGPTLPVHLTGPTPPVHLTDPTPPAPLPFGVEESRELATVIGLDWQGLTDTFISLQWFHSRLLDYRRGITRARRKDTLSFKYERSFHNETWTLEWLNLHSADNGDGLMRPKLTYLATTNLEIWVGADVFYGDERGVFGQFDRQDRFSLGFKLGF